MGRIAKPQATAIIFEPEERITLDELELDMNNNRIAHLEFTDKQDLETKLWREVSQINSLKSDIKERGLQEPLVLYPNGNTVAEGNCRLACLRRLQQEAHLESQKDQPFVSDLKLKKFVNPQVLCKRITQNTSEVDIDAYLTEIHVGRKRKWPQYNQAKLLSKLKLEDDLTLEEIARISRSSRPTISRKIDAYRYTTMYHEEFRDDTDFVKRFYYFWEFTNKSLEKFRENDSNIKKFLKWINSGKFSNSKQVRNIPNVLADDKTRRKFEESDMNGALEILTKTDPTITSPLYRKVLSLENTLVALSYRERRLLSKDNSRRIMLQGLVTTVNELLKETDEEDEE